MAPRRRQLRFVAAIESPAVRPTCARGLLPPAQPQSTFCAVPEDPCPVPPTHRRGGTRRSASDDAGGHLRVRRGYLHPRSMASREPPLACIPSALPGISPTAWWRMSENCRPHLHPDRDSCERLESLRHHDIPPVNPTTNRGFRLRGRCRRRRFGGGQTSIEKITDPIQVAGAERRSEGPGRAFVLWWVSVWARR